MIKNINFLAVFVVFFLIHPCLTLGANPSVGQNALGKISPPDQDVISIIFDLEDRCANTLELEFGTASAYVILQDASDPSGVSGFAFCLCNSDGSPLQPPGGSNTNVTGYTLPPGAFNGEIEPCFAVGLASPMPWAPNIVLLTINLHVLLPGGEWAFGVEPLSPYEETYYVAGDNLGLSIPMQPVVEPSCAIAFLNHSDPCGVCWGDITVDAEPDHINAPWTLEGPEGFFTTGNGDMVMPCERPGMYILTWEQVPGWRFPASNPDSLDLDLEGSITFVGTYTVLFCGDITIDAEPDHINAPWTLEGPEGFFTTGNGDMALPCQPPGMYILTWEQVPDWQLPPSNPDSLDLDPGGNITFVGTYTDPLATVIPSIPYSNTGNTCGYLDNYDEVCPNTGSTSPDVVYSFSPGGNMWLGVDLCGSQYNTKTYIYDSDLNLIDCNDDYYFSGPPCFNFTSRILRAPLVGGEDYYIVIDGSWGECGDYELTVTEAQPPCENICQTDAVAEGEPSLVYGYEDNWNGGCFSEPPVFQNIDWANTEPGEAWLCGVSGWYLSVDAYHRDTDWFTATALGTEMVFTVESEYECRIMQIAVDQFCEYTLLQEVIADCELPGTLVIPTEPGEIVYLRVHPTIFFSPDGTTEFNYSATLSGHVLDCLYIPSTMTAVTAAVEPVSVFTLPDGGGNRLDDCFILGGVQVDATITVTLEDGCSQPMAGVPAEDLWLVTTNGGLVAAAGGANADSSSGANGQTTFSGAIAGGGSSGGELTQVVVRGMPLTDHELDISFNSADMDADLDVDLGDQVLFNRAYWNPGYDYAADFFWDGMYNLSDVGMIVNEIGISNGIPQQVSPLQSTLKIVFDAGGYYTDCLQGVMPGTPVYAFLLLENPQESEVNGFEVTLEIVPSIGEIWVSPIDISGPAAWNLGAQNGNILEYSVGYSEPFSVGGPTILASQQIVLFYADQSLEFYLKPPDTTSLPNNPAPAYLGSNLDLYYLMMPVSGDFDLPVAGINGGCSSWTAVTTSPLGYSNNSSSVAWADFDDDGDEDLYLGNRLLADNRLLQNDGNDAFSNVTTPILEGIGGSRVATWCDYDNDGYPDLYLGFDNDDIANQLLHNDGGGNFSDATSGPLGQLRSTSAAAWADYDNDGNLDLYLALQDTEPANVLLHNNGDGSFSDVTTGPLAGVRAGRDAAWGDLDNDGDLDLYLSNQGAENRLLRNDGDGLFVDITDPLLANGSNTGRAAAWGDYDNDGDLDLYLANWGQENKLLRNDGGGLFSDATSGPLGDASDSAGAGWADYDNDGDLDLYLVASSQPNKLLRNDGGGNFVDVTWPPLDNAAGGGGLGWADHDGDGDLDLYLATWISGAENVLLRNDLNNGNHWLHIKLVGVVSNRQAVGARVRVVANGESQIRQVGGDAGYLSQNSLAVEFGLGSATMVDSLIVRWPSGIVQDTVHVEVDQRIVISEYNPASGEDLTDRLPTKIALVSCYPNPFNPQTTMAFDLPRQQSVSLRIFDMAGRLVRELIAAEPHTPGRHEVVWNGRDDAGRQVASGTYFYRLEAGSFSETKRMVLIK